MASCCDNGHIDECMYLILMVDADGLDCEDFQRVSAAIMDEWGPKAPL